MVLPLLVGIGAFLGSLLTYGMAMALVVHLVVRLIRSGYTGVGVREERPRHDDRFSGHGDVAPDPDRSLGGCAVAFRRDLCRGDGGQAEARAARWHRLRRR